MSFVGLKGILSYGGDLQLILLIVKVVFDEDLNLLPLSWRAGHLGMSLSRTETVKFQN